MAYSLLEMRARLGFLRDSNMEKEPRAGQPPAQAFVSLDCRYGRREGPLFLSSVFTEGMGGGKEQGFIYA